MGTTSADASGSGNAVTLNSSGVSWTTAGHSGNALNFDGASGYVEAASATTLDVREELSLSAWVYLTGNAAGTNTVISKENAYRLEVANGQVRMAVQTATGPAMAAVGAGSVPLNTWTHVKGTYDGSDIRIFVNGALVYLTSYPHGIIAQTTTPLRIGAQAGSAFFTGRIDEVRISGEARQQTGLRIARGQAAFGSLTCPSNAVLPGAVSFHGNAGEWVTLTFSMSGRGNTCGHAYADLRLDGALVSSTGVDERGCGWRRNMSATVHRQLTTTGTHTFSALFQCGSGMTSFSDTGGEWPNGGVSYTVMIGG